MLQQVSFRCNSLDDVIGFYRRLKLCGIKFDMIVSHGNAVGVYFYDPEGNRIETYWNTGLKAKQPYAEPIDLDQSADELRRHIEQHVAEHGTTGFIDRTVIKRQNI